MKIVAAIVLTLAFICCSGCRRVSNDEIVRETKKCRDAGMDARQVESGDIFCVPREQPK